LFGRLSAISSHAKADEDLQNNLHQGSRSSNFRANRPANRVSVMLCP